ncbi:hypothetical protein [Streptomyces canus]|uniref:hypothetical protein n=1 Tax=Streptomyces canus TaxID=58343 RepID=UPI00225A7D1C|nr:hypothetical protein [Streptomyces canus]MCX4854931.1 hypothetical protein [Streptomyces canus]
MAVTGTHLAPGGGAERIPLQIAAFMARKDTPGVAVVERIGDKVRLTGAVTTTTLLEHIIGGS